MPRHIHADCIIAWAGGAKIQYRVVGDNWIDTARPKWSLSNEYRVKPEPEKVEYRLALMRGIVGLKPFVHAYSRSGLTEEQFQTAPNFIRWLGDSITVEV